MAPTSVEHRRVVAAAMSERELQDLVLDAARHLGWRAYHTHDSRRSEPGFPDLVLVHRRGRRVLWRELKAQRGVLTRAQAGWLDDLVAVGADARVWRPADWLAGTIADELTARGGVVVGRVD